MIVTVQTGQMGLNYSMRGKLERGCWRLFSHTSFILGGWSLLSQFHHTILTLEGMSLGNALTQPLFLVFESLAFQSLLYPKRTWRASFHISLCSFCL